MLRTISRFLLFAGICLQFSSIIAQSSNSILNVDGGLMPSSPNAQAFETSGNTPVSLYEGIPSVGLPVYIVKCGTLSLPISLSYNYNGLRPLQDAGWVGLGWNLDVGGVITRYLQGAPDGSEPTGYNYGEYSLTDSLFKQNNNTFLQNHFALLITITCPVVHFTTSPLICMNVILADIP